MAYSGPQPPAGPLMREEGIKQNVAMVTIPVVERLPSPGWYGGLVAVDAGQHGLSFAVEAVEVGQPGAESFDGVRDPGPSGGVRRDLPRQPVRRAGRVDRLLVGEVPVDGQPGDARFPGDPRDSRLGRAHGPVEVDRSLDNPPPGLVHLLGALAHLVRARFRVTLLFTQTLDTRPGSDGRFRGTQVYR